MNIDVGKLRKARDQAKSSSKSLKRKLKIDGEWNNNSGCPQFAARVELSNGEYQLLADSPTFLGGNEMAPSPIQYFAFGCLSCYAVMFANNAALAGVDITSIKAHARGDLSYSTMLNATLGDIPFLTEFTIHLDVDLDTSDNIINDIKARTDANCPALWIARAGVPVSTIVTNVRKK